jgi:hypothetical protein
MLFGELADFGVTRTGSGMRFASMIGLVAIAGAVVPALTGQQAVPAASASANCTGPFVKVASPSPGTADNILFATAAAGAGHMWAVGRQYSGTNYRNLILSNAGHGWSQVAAPNSGPADNQLTGVSASGPSDAWAAGWYYTGDSAKPFAPQALHWDGFSWTAKPLPALPGELDTDTSPGIVDISPTDAWLVGAYLSGSTDGSVLAHWDGTSWSLVTHPAAAIALTALAASGPNDVWAVGVGPGPSFSAVIEHYNGSAWTTSATLPGIRLGSVSSVSPAVAWAVGTSNGGNATATVEWNGSAWKVVPSPNPGSSPDSLTAVSALAANDVWAVGSDVDFGIGVGESQPMAMHWDGTAWTAVPATGTAPDVFGETGTFFGVVALTATHVVAVGFGSSQADSLVADLCPFTVRDTGFAPSSANVSAPGAAAYWAVPASDETSHQLVDSSGFGLFDSGPLAPGSSYAFAFPASGTYLVTDKTDGASEKVSVPMLAITNFGGRKMLEWANAAPPVGVRFQIQDIPPGDTKFILFRNTRTTGCRLALQLAPGTYRFRSRMRDGATGAATGWSPTVTVTLP